MKNCDNFEALSIMLHPDKCKPPKCYNGSKWGTDSDYAVDLIKKDSVVRDVVFCGCTSSECGSLVTKNWLPWKAACPAAGAQCDENGCKEPIKEAPIGKVIVLKQTLVINGIDENALSSSVVKQALETSIAKILGIKDSSRVRVLSIGSPGRRLESGDVELTYAVSFPSDKKGEMDGVADIMEKAATEDGNSLITAVAQGISEATGKEYNLKITAKKHEQDTIDEGTMITNSSSAVDDYDMLLESMAAGTVLSSMLLCCVASFAIMES